MKLWAFFGFPRESGGLSHIYAPCVKVLRLLSRYVLDCKEPVPEKDDNLADRGPASPVGFV